MQWQTVIGLEIHTQLSTKSKIFSAAATQFGAKPNTQACAVDLGLPGVLPLLNKEAVVMAIKFALAINAKINCHSIFARKNYFYADLPKGYQISQFEIPIVGKGEITITLKDGSTKTIAIRRAHLEEDAGKSIHDLFANYSAIDLNRAGTPLLEIVSEPEMNSSAEALAYVKKIHSLVQYLEIGDGNMAEGSFRCDVNISLRAQGEKKLGVRSELKNINSFKFIQNAIDYEIDRQRHILESGGQITQETRLYDAVKNQTRAMRSKEEANDYRYFPDPDLLPLVIEDAFIVAIKKNLPELPDVRCQRFIKEFALNNYDAKMLTAQKALADYFETALKVAQNAKMCANWILVELSGALNKAQLDISQSPLCAKELGVLIRRIIDKTISSKIAKEILAIIFNEGGQVDTIIKKRGLKQLTDNDAIAAIIDEIITKHPKQVGQYQSGHHKMLAFFVGQVMKATKGKANPKQVNELLEAKIK